MRGASDGRRQERRPRRGRAHGGPGMARARPRRCARERIAGTERVEDPRAVSRRPGRDPLGRTRATRHGRADRRRRRAERGAAAGRVRQDRPLHRRRGAPHPAGGRRSIPHAARVAARDESAPARGGVHGDAVPARRRAHLRRGQDPHGGLLRDRRAGAHRRRLALAAHGRTTPARSSRACTFAAASSSRRRRPRRWGREASSSRRCATSRSARRTAGRCSSSAPASTTRARWPAGSRSSARAPCSRARRRPRSARRSCGASAARSRATSSERRRRSRSSIFATSEC